MRRREHPRAGRALIFSTALVLAACSVGPPPGDAAASSSGASHPSSTTPAAPVRIQISPTDGRRDVAPARVVEVTATGGTLTQVSVRARGDRASGVFGPQRTSWHSTSTLHVSSAYTVTASATGADGRAVEATARFRTLVPRRTFSASVAEQPGAVYGVGMPIQVSFDRPVRDRAAVERALGLHTSKPVIGAWRWLDNTHVDFRPRDYWPPHTTVTVSLALDGVRAAPGVYGSADRTRRFRIGRSLIVVASTRTHRLRLYKDGALFRNWPISTGRPGHDTPNGTYLTIDKANPVEMRPAGLSPGDPDYYDLWVPWAVRFTWNGVYLHDAYWSVAQQGHVNVSHGCVNMPPAAAKTYYQLEVPGDPVTIVGSPLAGDPANGWTDWFYTWSRVLAGSALHQAVVAGPGGSRFVDPSTLPASSARAPLGRPAEHNAAAS